MGSLDVLNDAQSALGSPFINWDVRSQLQLQCHACLSATHPTMMVIDFCSTVFVIFK